MVKKLRTYSGTTDGKVSERELKNREIARRAAAEGIVLLKNDGVLPLSGQTPVALCGGGAVKTIKGGTGSGDVNERETVSIYQGFLNAGMNITNRAWLESCIRIYQTERENWKKAILEEMEREPSHRLMAAYSKHIFRMPAGEELTKENIGDAEVGVYVISRTAGEDADRFAAEGDYYLTQREKEDLAFLSENVPSLVVLLNVGGPIDLKEIQGIKNLKALLMVSQPGMEGGNAIADVLSGAVNPSGRLTDTWAVHYDDYPNSETFSHNNGNVEKEYYGEGIFVGHRYFDTFHIAPAYPFGFGLSYTDFEITVRGIETDGREVKVNIEVKNIGSAAGKEVVQVYVSAPQGGLAKEFRRLCGFGKTDLLQAGQAQELVITFPVKAMASFHSGNSAWVAEKGTYGIWVGNDLMSAKLEGLLEAEEDTILESVPAICPLQEELQELAPPAEEMRERELRWKKEAAERGIQPVRFVPQPVVLGKPFESPASVMAEELVQKLTEEELAAMCIGEVTKGQGNVLGAAGVMVPGAAGETNGILEEKYGVPGVSMADGPAGLRLMKKYEVDRTTGQVYTEGILSALEGGFFASKEPHENTDTYYQYATAIPVGTLLAQTWDVSLVAEVGKAVAEEMLEFGVSWWLAPGMNIHRNPLCGRNFEYYSEDPVVSGRIAAAITLGVQFMPGVGTTIKHFACNNQEDNRMGSDSIVSERALREIYLRGFEIAVKTSQPMAIMTSYNLINGVHTANSHDLCIEAARKEWDFKGIIMTDWTTTSKRGGSSVWKCIAAGNDLIMPGTYDDRDSILNALHSGELDRNDLEDCVKRLLTVIFQTSAYEDAVSYGEQFIGCGQK